MKIFSIIALCSIVFIPLLIFYFIKRKKKKLEDYNLEIKSRNNELDEKLMNPLAERIEGEYLPYQERYAEGTEKRKNYKPSFQLIEKTERVQRQYLFQQNEAVYIGIKDGNLSVFKSASEGICYCRINFKQNVYYIKVMGTEPIQVKRKKLETIVGHEGIILKNKDKVCLLNAEYVFQIIRS